MTVSQQCIAELEIRSAEIALMRAIIAGASWEVLQAYVYALSQKFQILARIEARETRKAA